MPDHLCVLVYGSRLLGHNGVRISPWDQSLREGGREKTAEEFTATHHAHQQPSPSTVPVPMAVTKAAGGLK